MPARRTARQMADAQRQAQAIELRLAGYTYDQIAQQLGYHDKATSYRSIQRALKTPIREAADDLRSLEARRLDRLQAAVWPAAIKGDLGAVDRAVKVSESRRKLYGLDAPAQVVQQTTQEIYVRFDGDPPQTDAVAGSDSA